MPERANLEPILSNKQMAACKIQDKNKFIITDDW